MSYAADFLAYMETSRCACSSSVEDGTTHLTESGWFPPASSEVWIAWRFWITPKVQTVIGLRGEISFAPWNSIVIIGEMSLSKQVVKRFCSVSSWLADCFLQRLWVNSSFGMSEFKLRNANGLCLLFPSWAESSELFLLNSDHVWILSNCHSQMHFTGSVLTYIPPSCFWF